MDVPGQTQPKWDPHFKVSGCKAQDRGMEGGGRGLARGRRAGRGEAGELCARELAQEGTAWRVALPQCLSLQRSGPLAPPTCKPAGPHLRGFSGGGVACREIWQLKPYSPSGVWRCSPDSGAGQILRAGDSDDCFLCRLQAMPRLDLPPTPLIPMLLEPSSVTAIWDFGIFQHNPSFPPSDHFLSKET